MKIAYINYKTKEETVNEVEQDEDTKLFEFLISKGFNIKRLIWKDPAVNWKEYDIAILKSPWDYHENINEFHKWLDDLKAQNVKLLNSVETVKWNSDKHYLQDISREGLKIIPSLFIEKETIPNYLLYFDQLEAEQLVIKPCVSAGAKNTIVVNRENINVQRKTINQLLKEGSYIVQPFMKEILQGERSFLFFHGEYSHCILKVPKNGDFRVQTSHGGYVKLVNPEMKYIKKATEYILKFAKGSLYARVDGLIKDDEFYLMELEVIEPYLFLNMSPGSYDKYYNGLVKLI